MSNTGILAKDGILYLNGEPIQGGGSPIHNTFRKICVYGTSIEVTPSYDNTNNKCWPWYMALKLGLTYGAQVVNYGYGGGGITWYGNDTSSTAKSNILAGFSCTQDEKQAAADYFVAQGYMTAEEVTAAKSGREWNIGFEKSVLEEEDVDLYIFSTYGINDRANWMAWTDAKGNTQTSFAVFSDNYGFGSDELTFDRRTIYGAYNYVLRALYQQNPNAKVVILGQHSCQWNGTDTVEGTASGGSITGTASGGTVTGTVSDDTVTGTLSGASVSGTLSGASVSGTVNRIRQLDDVNSIQQAVAEKWQIPFADWGNHISFNYLWDKSTKQYANWQSDNIKANIYTLDGEHPRRYGAQLLGEWVADWITKTELKNMNPRWGLGS